MASCAAHALPESFEGMGDQEGGRRGIKGEAEVLSRSVCSIACLYFSVPELIIKTLP